MVRSLRALVLAFAIAATPAVAQVAGSDGEAFLTALKAGDGGKALGLVEKNGSTVVNYRGADGNAALHIAAHNRNGNWMGFLLSRDADPNVADNNGDTPLIISARLNFSEGAARLLMKNAIVDKTNKLGETALIVAVQQRQGAIVKMLLESGANPDKADHASGYSARDYAKRDTRSPEILKLIETVKSRRGSAVGPTKP